MNFLTKSIFWFSDINVVSSFSCSIQNSSWYTLVRIRNGRRRDRWNARFRARTRLIRPKLSHQSFRVNWVNIFFTNETLAINCTYFFSLVRIENEPECISLMKMLRDRNRKKIDILKTKLKLYFKSLNFNCTLHSRGSFKK